MNGPHPAVRVFPHPRAVAEGAAAALAAWAREAVAAHGRCALALSGGRTPAALYRMLADAGPAALPYERLDVFWGDERAVPPDAEESNYRLAWTQWLARTPLAAAQVHRIPGEEEPETAAARYEAELVRALGDPPRLDVILLGVGRDGHTASLFPGAAALQSNRLVTAAAAPAAPRRRVTLTLRAINAAARVLVLVTGGDKAEAVRRALQEPPTPDVPASLLRAAQVQWFLDAAAAGALRTEGREAPRSV